MPLLDHFHPPLSQRRHWDSFHGAWAEAIAVHLNQALLPPRYVAEARVKLGVQVEIDVATFEEEHAPGAGGVATWAPPKPTTVLPIDIHDLDTFEVVVVNEEAGPKVVAAIELVSPRNKDRPASRRQFTIKCASYLLEGVALAVVDVVTSRKANLHRSLLELLKLTAPAAKKRQLYAAAYRTLSGKETEQLELWTQPLALGASLPTLPLWLDPVLCVPLDLEETYQAACAARRIS